MYSNIGLNNRSSPAEPLDRTPCRFCRLVSQPDEAVIIGSVAIVKDAYPVTPGHHLILPRRHVKDYFEMSATERMDADRAIMRLRAQLLGADGSIKGFNIGTNAGEAAGQTVPHAHIHFMPRRLGDTPAPRGGVRGVIPDRMQY